MHRDGTGNGVVRGVPELLAPAGDREALVAAVQNGADAVYLGGTAFNARMAAPNFAGPELARALEYAHARGVRVYVTVNILIADRELEEAAAFLRHLYELGADGVIVQDLGLARLARRVLPELPLHASTQMTVHNAGGLRLLEELGFRRVILARELSLEALRDLRRRTALELEIFVHGALCVCYSGQCLLSSLVGGRSGNRGRCAQPCRLPYELVDGKGVPLVAGEGVGDYLLSPRDLNLSPYLREIAAAGVDALKIEGRLKRPEYVATVVRVYRAALDRLAEGREQLLEPEEVRDLAQIFNRGFTPGYLPGPPGRSLMSYTRPNNRGLQIGRVRSYDSRRGLAFVALEEDVRAGDGLEFWTSAGGRLGVEVRELVVDGRVAGEAPAGAVAGIRVPRPVGSGDRVFRTHDARLVARARATFASPREWRREPLWVVVEGAAGTPLTLRARDRFGREASAATAAPLVPALRHPLTPEFLREQLDRLGNTPFRLAGLECRLEGDLTVPVSEINAARRRVVEELLAARVAARRPAAVAPDEWQRRLAAADQSGPRRRGRNRPKLAVAAGSVAAVRAAVEAGADAVYFGGDFWRDAPVGREELLRVAELVAGRDVAWVLSSPRILTEAQWPALEHLVEAARGLPVRGLLAGNLGVFYWARRRLPWPVYSDLGVWAFNRQTCALLAELGAGRVTLSPELTLDQVRELAARSPVPVEVIVHGRLPVMVSEYCPLGCLLGGLDAGRSCRRPCRDLPAAALRDRLGLEFPLAVDRFCRLHLFNSRDLCLMDHLPAVVAAGVDWVRIEARRADPDYVRNVVAAYREGLEAVGARVPGRFWSEARERLAALSPTGITRGHYFRGVM
jgi:putative protease